MENVKGILSSQVDNEGVFKQLINDLQNPVESYKKLEGEENIIKSKIRYKIFIALVCWPELFLLSVFSIIII